MKSDPNMTRSSWDISDKQMDTAAVPDCLSLWSDNLQMDTAVVSDCFSLWSDNLQMDTAVVSDCLSLWSERELTDGRSSCVWFCQWSCRPVPVSAWQTWTACWPDTAADTQRPVPSSPALTKTQPHSATRHLLFSIPDTCSSPSQPHSATRHLLFSFTTTLSHQTSALLHVYIINKTKN